ncbi:hypothetical protein ONZ45_g10823 [Pleurotus djamor]|nr:hypothetical protein ONZ45_g18635 [Pleurotus djamor]KAJ8503478.1 hypothetical protein ONZ45_g10823 [Pleurotus djamor]
MSKSLQNTMIDRILKPSDDTDHQGQTSDMEQQAKAPPEIKKVAQFLRSGGAGLKVRVGAMNGKRLDYFKGKSAVKALLSPDYQKLKGVPKVTTEDEARTVLHAANAFAFYLRVARGEPSGSSSSSPKNLQIIQEQLFSPDEYYAWFYEGSQWTTYAGGIGMVAILFAGVMFPLWPPTMRLGVWYLSMAMLGFLALFFVIAIIRLIFYIITIIVAPPGIWIFPQLFADVGFVDSFIPLYEWDLPKKKGKKKKTEKVKADKKGKGKAVSTNGEGASIVEVDSEDAKPSRRVMVEEVDDDDEAASS